MATYRREWGGEIVREGKEEWGRRREGRRREWRREGGKRNGGERRREEGEEGWIEGKEEWEELKSFPSHPPILRCRKDPESLRGLHRWCQGA